MVDSAQTFFVRAPDISEFAGSRSSYMGAARDAKRWMRKIRRMLQRKKQHMHLAAEKGKHLRLRQFLSQSGNVDAFDARGRTALYLAASNGHLRCVAMLLNAKADINLLSKGHASTPIVAASMYGHLDVVTALIESRADINKIVHGVSVLCDASRRPNGHPIVAALLDAGALVDLPGASYSPLTGAIESGSIESLKLLIAAGADVNGDGYEIHPLHTATITDNVDAAKLLIDAKADVKSHRGFQESLLLAVDLGFVNMTKLYISAGADVNMYSPQLRLSCLHALATKDSPDGSLANPDLEVCDHKQNFADRINNIPCDHMGVFQVLIDAKADVSARVSGGRTALSSSARWNNIQVVNALLAAGANANDVDDNGMTPLIAAACGGHIASVSALVAAGADVNHAAGNGRTALSMAVLCGYGGVVSALIAARADVHVVDKKLDNMPLINIAAQLLHLDIVAMLMKAGARYGRQCAADERAVEGEGEGLVNAASHHDLEKVRALVGSANEEDKNMALLTAVHMNDLPIVTCLLAAGADVSAQLQGISALVLASINGYTDVARELLGAGADFTEKDLGGKTALQWAAKHKHRDVVALLLATAKELKSK